MQFLLNPKSLYENGTYRLATARTPFQRELGWFSTMVRGRVGAMVRCAFIFAFAVAMLLMPTAWAGPVSSAPAMSNTIGGFSATQPPLKSIAPGIFELGRVRVDVNRRCISFPAALNMNQALVEYLLVTSRGKTHESLLKTEAEPYHIHAAMLLLGAKGSQGKPFPEDKKAPLPGDNVRIEIGWQEKGQMKTFRAEEWILDQASGQPASPGEWAYLGARFENGVFTAQQEGSIISMIEDPDALINNPRAGRDNDDNWRIKSSGLPPLESAVEVKIFLDGGAQRAGTVSPRGSIH